VQKDERAFAENLLHIAAVDFDRTHVFGFRRSCAHASAWIVEDDYDSEYRYTGRPLAPLHALAEG
jgi:hypothetical protein